MNLLLANLLFAHPHVFVDYALEVVFGNKGMEGLQVTWHFDDMFSWQIVTDYTSDQNFEITAEESKIIENEAFSYLAESGYFADFYINGIKHEIDQIQNFEAECIDEVLIYHFFIPWQVEAKKEMIKLKLGFVDETIFVDLLPQAEGLTVKYAAGIAVEYFQLKSKSYQLNFWNE